VGARENTRGASSSVVRNSAARRLPQAISVRRVNKEKAQMNDEERQTLRNHIIFLGTQLEQERKRSMAKSELLRRLLDREDLGWAVTDEVRSLAYQCLTDEYLQSREKENRHD
jgi:hypothetical protein